MALMDYNKKSVDLLVTSFKRAKNREFLAVLAYKKQTKLFRGEREYSTDETLQLIGTITALKVLHNPVNVILYLNSNKLSRLLNERLRGYITQGNIHQQSQSQLLLEYHQLSMVHQIEIARGD
jgi:hypothetical protein